MMKLLFAAPDRDLLECFGKLLQSGTCQVVTAFDGTQVLSPLSAEGFDIVVLDRELPRVGCRNLIEKSKEKHIPVILLTCAAVGARQLTEEPLPNAFLTYPFTAAQLEDVIRGTLAQASGGTVFPVGGRTVDAAAFRFREGPSLTAEETRALQRLLNGEAVPAKDGALVGALNEKLARTAARARILYRAGKGFELVTDDE